MQATESYRVKNMLPSTMGSVNPKTGVRYGVIALERLQDWVAEEFTQEGNNDSYEAALKEFNTSNPEATNEEMENFCESYDGEEDLYSLEIYGMQLKLFYLGGIAHVLVMESPHKATTLEYGPSISNAGDLSRPYYSGGQCYSLPLDWFEGTFLECIRRGFSMGLSPSQIFEELHDDSDVAEFAISCIVAIRQLSNK